MPVSQSTNRHFAVRTGLTKYNYIKFQSLQYKPKITLFVIDIQNITHKHIKSVKCYILRNIAILWCKCGANDYICIVK